MSDAPERIWACVSKNTKSGVVTLLGDATFQVDGWQEYVRADLIEALTKERDQHWDSFVHWRKEADDRSEQLTAAQQDADEAEAYAEELEKERDEARAAWEIEAATVRRFAERHTRHLVMGAEARDGAERAEAKLAKAVEVLEALIQLAHDCEKKLTEDLHHMDFCGESEPLTKARTTLAEIKGESHE